MVTIGAYVDWDTGPQMQTIGLGIVLIGALLLLFYSLLKRRAGGHPQCLKCKYDLYGLKDDVKHCPECGADLSARHAVITDQSFARARRIAAVFACVMITFNLGYGGWRWWDWARTNEYDLYDFKPLFWLLSDIQGEDQAAADKAWVELEERTSNQEMSDQQIQEVIKVALSLPFDTSLRWERLRIYIGNARGAEFFGPKHVSDKQWKSYAEGLWSEAEFDLRPRISEDGPWVIRYLRGTKESSESFNFLSVKIKFDVTGHSHAAPGVKIHRQMTMSTTDNYLLRSLSHLHVIELKDEFAALKLPPGNHTVSAQVTPLLSAPHGEWTAGLTFKVSKKLEVVAKDIQLVRTTTDPALRDAVLKAVRFERCGIKEVVFSGNGSFYLKWDHQLPMGLPLPVSVAFDIDMRQGPQEMSVGQMVLEKSSNRVFGSGQRFDYVYSHWMLDKKRSNNFHTGRVDLILKPNVAYAAETLNIYQIWGEPIVIKDVPFKRREDVTW